MEKRPFAELGLSPEVLKAVERLGFEVLARRRVELLNVEQVVVRGRLTLAVLVAAPLGYLWVVFSLDILVHLPKWGRIATSDLFFAVLAVLCATSTLLACGDGVDVGSFEDGSGGAGGGPSSATPSSGPLCTF